MKSPSSRRELNTSQREFVLQLWNDSEGVVTRAHARGLLKWNPFGQFHIAKNIRPREYLTEEEIALLMTHDFKKPALSFARDIFIFAAFTGLAFQKLDHDLTVFEKSLHLINNI